MSRDFVWSSFIIWHTCLLECSESWNNKHFLQNNTCNKISNTRTGKAASTKKYCPQNMVESLKRVRRLVNNLYKPTDSKWLILVTKKTTNTKEEEQRFLSSMVFSVYEVFSHHIYNKPTMQLKSNANDIVNTYRHARENPLLPGYLNTKCISRMLLF